MKFIIEKKNEMYIAGDDLCLSIFFKNPKLALKIAGTLSKEDISKSKCFIFFKNTFFVESPLSLIIDNIENDTKEWFRLLDELKKKDSICEPFEMKNVFQFKLGEYEMLFEKNFIKDSWKFEVLEKTIQRFEIEKTKKFKFFQTTILDQSKKMKQRDLDEKVIIRINELMN